MSTHIIRVTQLLRWAGITKPIPQSAHIQRALVRGSAVHRYSIGLEKRMAEGGDSATTCLDSWPKNLVPYGQAIAQFHAIYRPEFHHTEERITDEPLHLTGCPDRVGVVKGYRTVVDYKTGGEYAWHRLQLALYAILLDRINQPTDIRMAVYLSKEGECRTVIHKANKDILEAWSLIKEYGEAINGQSKQKKTSTHDS